MTPEVRKQIEEGVKELAKKSTAPDKETPDWMETDIRRGAEFGYSLACKSSHPEQGEQGELYRLIKHVAECAFNSRVQIEGSAGFEVWWQEELKMNRKLREIESKLSSPPPEGQNEYEKGYADGWRDATKEAAQEIKEHYKPNNE